MIRVAKVCGCCSGAKRAIDLSIDLSKNNDKVYVYKEILHNKNVIDTLEKMGVYCIDELDAAKDGVVVIRAHGEPKDTYKYLDDNHFKYYDATCVNVIGIHEIIGKKYNEGFSIIIIGKKNHPEVIGSNGWCDNSAFIIENEDDIDQLDMSLDKVFVICQTTFNKDKALKYIEKIKEKYEGKNVEVVNSICNASVVIQNSARELAKNSDIMIVIGGKNSSNTKELYNICSDICTSYMISSKDELFDTIKKIDINKNTNIGITAGASTMKSEIDEYKNIISFYVDYKDVLKKCIEYQNKYNKVMLSEEKNEILKDASSQLSRLNCDGKFIRAYLISLAYRMYGGVDDNYLPLATAYELFQTSILIHDDIIDVADKRRGKDTIPVYYKSKYDLSDIKIGNDLGICLGDYGFYYANKILVDNYKDNHNFLGVFDEFNKIVLNTIRGEILDVELPCLSKKSDKSIESDIFEIYSLKTSWYTILGPFRLGMLLSGKNDNTYDEILYNLGVCYQIRDDILGIFGDTKNTGKTISDISEGKQTILYSYVRDNKKYYDQLLKYYGKNNLRDDEIEVVKNIFVESGALEYTSCKENELFDKIIEKFDIISMNNEYMDILKGFVSYLQYRNR